MKTLTDKNIIKLVEEIADMSDSTEEICTTRVADRKSKVGKLSHKCALHDHPVIEELLDHYADLVGIMDDSLTK